MGKAGRASALPATTKIKKVIEMKQYAERFYKSKTWQKVRDNKVKSAGGLCEDCLVKGLIVPGVIVHHIQPITKANINNPAVTLQESNLKLLCRECHERAHRKKKSRYKICEDGHVIPIPDEV